MKRCLLFAFSLLFSAGLFAQNDVIFTVDMNNYGGSFTTVYLSGSFNSWSGDANPLDDSDGDGIWTTTLSLMDGDYEFKYSLDNWTSSEDLTPGEPCVLTTGNYTNRLVTVAGAPVNLGIVCYTSCDACPPGVDGNITFSVDMNEYVGAIGTVYVSGTFNSWSGDSNPLDDTDGDGIWTATINLPAGDHEFKYTIDNWAGQETLTEGDDCTLTTAGYTNRLINVNGDATIPTVCWQSCDACGAAVDGDVTFSVDMNEYVGAIGTVYVSGTFNSWSGDGNPLDDTDGDGVWTATYNIPAGDHEFKYTIDNWAIQESLTEGDDCTMTTAGYTNRSISVNGNMDIPTVCWESCNACGVTSDMVAITFNVNMSEFSVDPGGVYLAGGGSFGVPGDNAMTDPDGDGVYSITVMRPQGFSSFYTFANGACSDFTCKENIAGQDCADPANFNDRFLPAVTQDTTLNTCYQECTDDLECTPIEDGMITFSVDMNEYPDPFTTVYVAGTFNGWSGDGNPMDDSDGDGVWEATIAIESGVHEFKYELDNWAAQETLTPGTSCTVTTGNYTNRALEVMGDQTLETVCWESCEACGVTVDMVAITFNINMSEYVVDPGGVFLAGGGNFGVPGDNEMTDPDGDGVYSITVMRPEGFSSFYTFTNGACVDFSCKENIVGQPCADPDNFNDRFLPPVSQDTTLNTCYSECTDDLDCTPLAEPTMVTFQVNMADEMTSADGVFMGASFDGWSGGILMEDPDGDDVWTYTAEIQPGMIEWKYINGPDWCCQEEFAGGEDCTLTTGPYTNRVLEVGEDDITIDIVCFNSCDNCDTDATYSPYGNDLFRLAPSLTNGAPVMLYFDEASVANRTVRVSNAIGQVVYSATVGAFDTQHSIESAKLANGMYFVQVEVGNQQGLLRFIVSK